MLEDKVILVGENNPYGGDPAFALYPSPEGSAGYRLCATIFGMGRAEYLETFERVNLVVGKWSIVAARAAANNLRGRGRRLVLLGRKMCDAFDVNFVPFLFHHRQG